MKQSNSNTNNKQLLIDQYLPHNFLAEKMILSCLLINSEAIENTLRSLSVEAFYFKNHQEIYKAIIFMYKYQLFIHKFHCIFHRLNSIKTSVVRQLQ